MGKLINVIHKVRAYIEGITYGPGDLATIDELHFNESVHDEVDDNGNVIKREKVPEVEPLATSTGDSTNQASASLEPSPVPPRASNFVAGKPTVDDAAQSEPIAYDDSGPTKAAPKATKS